MLHLKFSNEASEHSISFARVSEHVVTIVGDIEANTSGFILSRDGKNDQWDYTSYTTVFRKLDNGIQFSNDGSVYIPPTTPTQPEPYTPSIDDLKESKIDELNSTQQEIIHGGVDVKMSDGSVERFTLTENDQISLMELQALAQTGASQIPWHNDNHSEGCKYYSLQDFNAISSAVIPFVTYHVTYFRDLRRYVNSLTDAAQIGAAWYGMPIPEAYQSDVLKSIIA